MKKLILILVVVAMAVPLYAAGRITFVATDNVSSPGTCTITFDANDLLGIEPVALGLDVKVNGSDPCHAITAVSGMESFFEIFMDYAYDDPCNYTYGAGHPVADPCAAGSIALPSHHFCVSMGGLGGESDPEEKAAPDNGTAFVLTAGNLKYPSTVTGHIKINALRGGVIGKDTDPMETNLVPVHLPFTITVSPDCFPSGHADYAMWLQAGKAGGPFKPNCWCPTVSGVPGASDYQCKGDADGGFGGKDQDGKRKWVTLPDNTILSAGWQKVDTDPSLPANFICADFDHGFGGKDQDGKRKWITLPDNTILSAGWQKVDTEAHFTTTPGTVMNPCFPIVIP